MSIPSLMDYLVARFKEELLTVAIVEVSMQEDDEDNCPVMQEHIREMTYEEFLINMKERTIDVFLEFGNDGIGVQFDRNWVDEQCTKLIKEDKDLRSVLGLLYLKCQGLDINSDTGHELMRRKETSAWYQVE